MFQKIARSTFALVIAIAFFQSAAFAAPDGKALFMSNCASCHNPLKDATGPALKGINSTLPSKEWLYDWVHNSAALIQKGDPEAVRIYNKFAKTAMTSFPQLKNEEIDAIIAYVNSVEPIKDGPQVVDGQAPAEDNTWLYSIITFALLVLAIVLWRANVGLRSAANEKDGSGVTKEIPVYRNKAFIAVFCIIVFIACGYWLTNGAVEMGRQQNYQPEQPIFYSHKVHAGINQINCLYCHAGAEKSRQAMIPSPNICMNCHKQIKEYTGADKHPLVTAEGQTVNGTAEIQKLYAYAGWNPDKKDYNRNKEGEIIAYPIKWAKIHNLPDHVYFNHSQHVKVGQVQCQRCHGQIQEMDEVYQFAPLSMGWCINCHRQTEVKFTDNNYYSIFTKYHDELKSGKRSKVTVEEIGGTECQKCHY